MLLVLATPAQQVCQDLPFDPNTLTWAGAFAVVGCAIVILAMILGLMFFLYRLVA